MNDAVLLRLVGIGCCRERAAADVDRAARLVAGRACHTDDAALDILNVGVARHRDDGFAIERMERGEIAPVARCTRCLSCEIADSQIAVDQDIARLSDRAARRDAGDTVIVGAHLIDENRTLDLERGVRADIDACGCTRILVDRRDGECLARIVLDLYGRVGREVDCTGDLVRALGAYAQVMTIHIDDHCVGLVECGRAGVEGGDN